MTELVPMNDLKRIWAARGPAFLPAINKVLESGWYVLGSECTTFEQQFSEYCGVKYCIGVANGTDALEISMRALNLKTGATIAMVANAGGYGALAAKRAGYIPLFIDVEPVSRLMDLHQLEALIKTQKIDAVLVTHLYGLMHDMIRITALLKETQIKLIEDCAQAHGARRDGRMAGASGNVACFSFYPTKNLGCFGDGGAVLTNSKSIADDIISLRQYGWGQKYRVVKSGGVNSRLDELQAAVLGVGLYSLNASNQKRMAIAQRYSQEIAHSLIKCPPLYGEEYVAHLYVVTCQERESLKNHLYNARIASDIHYPIPDNKQLGLISEPLAFLSVTEHLSQTVLSLPCFAEMRDEEVDRVVNAVNSWG